MAFIWGQCDRLKEAVGEGKKVPNTGSSRKRDSGYVGEQALTTLSPAVVQKVRNELDKLKVVSTISRQC